MERTTNTARIAAATKSASRTMKTPLLVSASIDGGSSVAREKKPKTAAAIHAPHHAARRNESPRAPGSPYLADVHRRPDVVGHLLRTGEVQERYEPATDGPSGAVTARQIEGIEVSIGAREPHQERDPVAMMQHDEDAVRRFDAVLVGNELRRKARRPGCL